MSGDAVPARELDRAPLSSTAVRTGLALLGGLVVLAVLVLTLGRNPARAAGAILDGSLGNRFAFSQTLQVWTILVLTGLASAVPFAARLWNVGGEGQMYVGAVTAAGLGITAPPSTSSWFLVPAILLLAAGAGACWGGVAAVLRTTFGASEIVTTLMLNFVGILVASYAIRAVWPQGFAQQTESVVDAARLPVLLDSPRVDISAPLAIVVAGTYWLLMSRTATGFGMRALGANRRAALLAGVNERLVTAASLALGGAAAGLAGGIFVLGINGALLNNFTSGLAFLGIAVALVARLNPALVIPVAGLFAILRVGSNNLQAGADLSPAAGDVLVAAFVIMLMVTGVIRFNYGAASDA